LAAAAILDFFEVPVVWFVCHMVMLESLKNFDNFKILIRKRQKLWNPFDLAQT